MAGLHVIERGACTLAADSGEVYHLERGDLILIPRGDGHTIGTGDGSPVTDFAELLGEIALSGRPLRRRDVRDGGQPANDRIVCGGYRYDHSVPHPLMSALPAFVHLRADELDRDVSLVLDLIFAELARDDIGSTGIVDRLLEVVLITGLRSWLRRHQPATPAWTAGIGDPVVSSALNHLAMSTPASITDWARAIGVSRSTLLARFADVVGEPPGAFLTRWRLDNAARLLRQTDLSVATVAHQVGYQSEFSFSRAFKRARGRSPLQFRKHHATQPADDVVGRLEATSGRQ